MTAKTSAIVKAKQAAEVGALIAGLDEAIGDGNHWTVHRGGGGLWEITVFVVVDTDRFFPVKPNHRSKVVWRDATPDSRGYFVVTVHAESLRQALIDTVELWLHFAAADAAPRLRLVVPA